MANPPLQVDLLGQVNFGHGPAPQAAKKMKTAHMSTG